MPGQAVLTIVVVPNPALRRTLAHHLARTGIHLVLSDAPGAVRRLAIRAPTILLGDETAIAGALGDRVAAGWISREWTRIITVTIDGTVLVEQSDRLRAIFAESEPTQFRNTSGKPRRGDPARQRIETVSA